MKNHIESVKKISNHIGLIPDHSYRILIIGGSGSGKTNVLLNLLKHQPPDINKIYSFVKDLFASRF